MKKTLEAEDQDKVWRMAGRAWPIYRFETQTTPKAWWCYPTDPRRSPGVVGIKASVSPRDGLCHSHEGWVEVPAP